MVDKLFNSLYFNKAYDYKKLGPIVLIVKYSRNNHFLTLKNKFGTILCISCGFVERSTTRKKRSYPTFNAVVKRLVGICVQKNINIINAIIFKQTTVSLLGLINHKLQPISFLFHINRIHVCRIRFIFVKPHHFGKKKRKLRRK